MPETSCRSCFSGLAQATGLSPRRGNREGYEKMSSADELLAAVNLRVNRDSGLEVDALQKHHPIKELTESSRREEISTPPASVSSNKMQVGDPLRLDTKFLNELVEKTLEQLEEPSPEPMVREDSLSTCGSTPKEPAIDKEIGDPIQVGDLVRLGIGAPAEYRDCRAVVTKVAETHCTVIVLEDGKFTGIGECWPGYQDVSILDRTWHLGSKVVINGMSSERTKHLNGLTGTVTAHPKNGHPSFIRKRSSPETPQLVICVAFHDVKAAREQKSAMLEPQFLQAFADAEIDVVRRLSQAIASIPATPRVASCDRQLSSP